MIRLHTAKLIHVLKHYKLNDNVINWIQDLLHERKQQTLVEGTLSHKSSVTSGVPQGSVLGPLEFALYLESLLTRLSTVCSSCSIYAYADDLKIVSSDKNELQHALHVVQQWATVWRLTIQPTKSEYICFGSNYKTKAPTTNEFYLSNTLIPHKTVV